MDWYAEKIECDVKLVRDEVLSGDLCSGRTEGSGQGWSDGGPRGQGRTSSDATDAVARNCGVSPATASAWAVTTGM